MARHNSFKSAAAELCVTLGAVSRHVSGLEAYLGVRLFDRQHRDLRLTAKGGEYHRTIQGALSDISLATSKIADERHSRTLRLKVPPTCAVRWLVPRLKRFNARHPDIAIQLATSHDPAHFDGEEIDAAIHYGQDPGGRVVTDRLFGEVLIPIMAPSLAQPRMRTPEELSRRLLLHSNHRPRDWPQWFETAGLGEVRLPVGLCFENSNITYQGAMDGVGCAVAQVAFVQTEMRTGRLLVPFDITVRNPQNYSFVFPHSRTTVRRIQQFRAWVNEEAALTRQAGTRYAL